MALLALAWLYLALPGCAGVDLGGATWFRMAPDRRSGNKAAYNGILALGIALGARLDALGLPGPTWSYLVLPGRAGVGLGGPTWS